MNSVLRKLLVGLLAVGGCSCSTLSSWLNPHQGPVRAPPEVAVRYLLPADVPEAGRRIVGGKMLYALRLAMSDFTPRLHPSPSEKADCAARPESYSVSAAPGPDDVMVIAFAIDAERCAQENAPAALALGRAYVIDTRTWQFLAPSQSPAEVVPEAGRVNLRGDLARAINVAMEDFRPADSSPPSAPSAGQRCLDKHEAYSAIAAPAVLKHVVFVSLSPDEQLCPAAQAEVDGGAFYAIETDDYRILATEPP